MKSAQSYITLTLLLVVSSQFSQIPMISFWLQRLHFPGKRLWCSPQYFQEYLSLATDVNLVLSLRFPIDCINFHLVPHFNSTLASRFWISFSIRRINVFTTSHCGREKKNFIVILHSQIARSSGRKTLSVYLLFHLFCRFQRSIQRIDTPILFENYNKDVIFALTSLIVQMH